MKLYHMVLLLTIIFAGCSTNYQIEQEDNLVSQGEDIVLNEVQNSYESKDLIDSKEEIEQDLIKETNSIKEEIKQESIKEDSKEKLLFSKDNSHLELELNKEYLLEVETQNKMYQYTFLVQEENNYYEVYIDGIYIPLDVVSLYFHLGDKELIFEKSQDNNLIISFGEYSKEIVEEELESELELEIDIEDDHIELEWDSDLENVKWYKVMHSTYNSDLKYPNQDAIAVITNQKEDSHKHWHPNVGINYYRISAVSEDDSIIHSNVVEVNFDYEIEEKEDFKEEKTSFSKTDSFNFWEDQESHNYLLDGATHEGAYRCDGTAVVNSVSYPNKEADQTLRLGSCTSGPGSVSLNLDVNKNSDKIKLVLQEATGGSSAYFTIDGVEYGKKDLAYGCEIGEYYFDIDKSLTSDGKINLVIEDGVPGYCSGDPQISFIEVYS